MFPLGRKMEFILNISFIFLWMGSPGLVESQLRADVKRLYQKRLNIVRGHGSKREKLKLSFLIKQILREDR